MKKINAQFQILFKFNKGSPSQKLGVSAYLGAPVYLNL